MEEDTGHAPEVTLSWAEGEGGVLMGWQNKGGEHSAGVEEGSELGKSLLLGRAWGATEGLRAGTAFWEE